jgi:hypothetical protein
LLPNTYYELFERLEPVTKSHTQQVPIQYGEKYLSEFGPVNQTPHVRFFSGELKQERQKHSQTHRYSYQEHVLKDLRCDEYLLKRRNEGPAEEQTEHAANRELIDLVREGLQEVIIVIVGLVILEQQIVKGIDYEIL